MGTGDWAQEFRQRTATQSDWVNASGVTNENKARKPPPPIPWSLVVAPKTATVPAPPVPSRVLPPGVTPADAISSLRDKEEWKSFLVNRKKNTPSGGVSPRQIAGLRAARPSLIQSISSSLAARD